MKIDFHVHTNDSPCSDLTLDTIVKRSLEIGLSGIAICNHNKRFELNAVIDDIEKRYNVRINPSNACDNAFYIIPGIEISTDFGHILNLEFDGDCISVIAHPFENNKSYSSHAKILSEKQNEFSIVECGSGRANYKNKSACNMAKKFADDNSIPVCAGSDAHFDYEIGNAWTEIPDSVGLKSIKESLLKNESKIFYKNEKRITIAKSQILKNGYTFKAFAFLIYCYIRDIGDEICRKSN